MEGEELLAKMTHKDGTLKYDQETIIDCGFELIDMHGNEYPDFIRFFEEVRKLKGVNIEDIEIEDIDISKLKKILNRCLIR